MVNLNVDLGRGLTLKNPVLTASGTFGYGEEFAPFVELGRLGGFIVKGTTLNPREGNDYPRIADTDSRLIVNVSGASPDDYAEVARRLAPLEKVAAVEVNISCPNVRQGGMAFGTTCEGAETITRAVRDAFPRHVMVKLSPNVTSVTDIALAAEGAGADSVSLINTLLGMAIDVERRRPYLSTITGGLSGPAVRPVAVRMVWQVAKAVKIPVVGLGGIMTARDALEFIMAGASAIEVGTANFVDPAVTGKIVDGIEEYLIRNGFDSIDAIRGII